MDQIKLTFQALQIKKSFNVTTKIIWSPKGLVYPLKNYVSVRNYGGLYLVGMAAHQAAKQCKT